MQHATGTKSTHDKIDPNTDPDPGPHTQTGLRVAGRWLTLGAVIWTVSLVLHPPPSPVLSEFMALVSDTGARWAAVHWGAAVSLSLFVVTSLIVLVSRSRLTATGWGLSGWALLPVASLWVLTTAVMEATAISHLAEAGDAAAFEPWHLFAEGNANGFLVIALAVAAIAGNEARAHAGATPSWAAWVAVVAGLTGFAGWILGPIAGIGIGGLLFVLSSVVFGLWLLWFGIGLTRSATSTVDTAVEEETTGGSRATR